MIRGIPAALIGATLMLLGPMSAQAAPPANDNFGAATAIVVGQEISATNLEATAEAGEPEPTAAVKALYCTGSAIDSLPLCTASVWYVFTAPESTTYTVETCDRGTDLDSILSVFTGATIGALAKVDDDDDSCPGGPANAGSRVTFAATAGTPYRISVNGYRSERGSFYLRVYPGAPQPRPAPDTGIAREGSFFVQRALNVLGESLQGVLSGPRHSASFVLRSDTPGASFECSLDGAAFSPCASPVSYDVTGGGSHEFRARASAAGATDPTPVVQRFFLDTAPPATSLASSPPTELASQSAEWLSATSEQDRFDRIYLCGADSHPLFGCGNPAQVGELCKGPHSFRSTAVDLAGNLDPTPATDQFNVTVGPACAPPTLGAVSAPFVESTRSGEMSFPYDDGGAGGTLHLDYGLTSSYGLVGRDQPAGPSGPLASEDQFYMEYLEPDTTYHYRITQTTPFGSASTGDLTLKTKPLGGSTRPVIQNGAPTVAGSHAALIPFSIDPQGPLTTYRLFIAAGEPVMSSVATEIEGGEVPAGTGPQQRSVQVVDLDPGTTYHYRVAAAQIGPGGTQVLGPEGTFTTRSAAAPKVVAPIFRQDVRFRLRRGQVRVGKLRRKSRVLRVRVRGLPAKSKAKLRLKVGKKKQSARKKAKPSGRAIFKVRLSKRIRKALLADRVKIFRLRVTALPPDDPPSSVNFRKRLAR